MGRDLKLKVIIDADGNAQREIGGLSGALGKLGGVGGIASAAAGGLALLGGGVLAAGAGLVSLGSDAEEMQSKFNVVFSQTGGQVTKDLDEFGNAVGRNKFELMGYAATLGDTLKPLGMTEEAAAKFATQLTELGVDLSSFNNMPMDEAMRRLQGTLIGSHENALAFGVVINENTLKAELAAMGADKLTGSQLEQAKVQARINLLMKGTSDAQGDAERTAGGWANQMRALQAELSESATAMGQELLPVLVPLLKDFTTWVRDVMPQGVAIFKDWAGQMKETVGPALVIINDAIDRVTVALGGQKGSLDLGSLALGAFKAVLDAVVIGVKLAAVTMKLFADGVEQGRRNWDAIRGATESARHVISSAMNSIRDGINGVIGAWDRMKDAARSAANAIPSWLRPGSPTPFEMGLRGIASAAGTVSKALPAAFAGTAMPGPVASLGATGGSSIVVQLTYSPVVSTASKMELETVLGPFISDAIRKTQGQR